MPWGGIPPSQTFSRSNGFNTGNDLWQQDDAGGVDIESSRHDTHDQDLADGISSCIKKDGGNAATSNLPMGGFRHTNVGAALARTQYARFADLQDGKGVYAPTVGGTANAITLTTGYSVDAYAAGQEFAFIAAFTNSAASTVVVDGLSAKDIKVGSTALSSGQILASTMVVIRFDGTQFQLMTATTAPAAIPVGGIMGWPVDAIPTGWLECDGSAVSRATYAALFATYGTQYGPGNGSTTFNLPNYRDYFLRGFDASGTDAASRTDRGDGTTGANVGTKQASDYLSHTHTGTTNSDGAHTHSYTRPESLVSNVHPTGSGRNDPTSFTSDNTGSSGAHTHTFTTAAAPTSGGNETRPKNVTVRWCCLALPAAAIAVGTGFTRNPLLCHTGGMSARVNTDGTDTTPSATETYIAQVFVPGPGSVTVTGISLFNGSVNAGNIKIGLADSAGNIVAQTASTAASGTDAYQDVPLTAAFDAVGPATYYVLLQNNNTSNRFNSHTFGRFGASKKTGETFGTFTTITPPTTFTTGLGPIATLY